MLLNTKRHGSALKELGLVGVAITSVDICHPTWCFIRNTHDTERTLELGLKKCPRTTRLGVGWDGGHCMCKGEAG